MEIHYALHRKE